MTRFLKALIGVTFLPAFFISSQAMAAAAPGSGRAIIITPFEFIHVDDMQFGTIVAGSSAGTVTIDAVSAGRSATGGVQALAGVAQRARFVGAGAANQTVDITLSAPPTLSDGNGNSMIMSSLDLDGPATRTIGPDLAFDVYVGGTLQVEADQAPGFYSGSFSLTVQYN